MLVYCFIEVINTSKCTSTTKKKKEIDDDGSDFPLLLITTGPKRMFF